MINKINLNLMLALKVLLEEKHVTRASKRLNITQPAMSSTLNRLRKVFNDELLVRVIGDFELTQKGQELLGKITPLIADFDSFVYSSVEFNPDEYDGVFHLGLCDHSAQILLPKINKYILPKIKNSRLDVHILNIHDALKALSKGDMSIGIGSMLNPPESLRYQKLFDDSIVCIFSERSVFNQNNLTIHDFLKARKVYYSYRLEGELTLLERFIRQSGYEAPPVIRSPYMTASLMCLLEDDMILVSSKAYYDVVKDHFPVEMTPLPFSNVPPLLVSQYWHTRYDNDLPLKWFRHQLKLLFQKTLPPA